VQPSYLQEMASACVDSVSAGRDERGQRLISLADQLEQTLWGVDEYVVLSCPVPCPVLSCIVCECATAIAAVVESSEADERRPVSTGARLLTVSGFRPGKDGETLTGHSHSQRQR
jgi:hypothetical protein